MSSIGKTLKNYLSPSSPKFLFTLFLAFILLHTALFNINAAEWGDSYRILRASEYLRELDYPTDEKRPPLFSLLLAIRPSQIDQVLWGRIELLLISIGSFVLFKKLLDLLINKESLGFFNLDVSILDSIATEVKNIALLLFVLNPVYLYWSIRIMADVPFALLAMLSFYYLYRLTYATQKDKTYIYSLLIGFFVGLSAITRFEGYILFGSLGLGLLFLNTTFSRHIFTVKNLLHIIKENISNILLYLFSFSLTLSPYIYFRNPFNSSYFEEPENRVYNLETLNIYLLSLLFVFGFVSAFYFIFNSKKSVIKFLFSHVGIASFISVETALVLAWPAAVPRLFTAVVPFYIIVLSLGIVSYFNRISNHAEFEGISFVSKVSKVLFSHSGMTILSLNFLLLGIYAVGQYYYKLQFLVLMKPLFVFVLVFSLLQIFLITFKKKQLFYLSLTIIMLVWSIATIWLHKDIFRVVQQANLYARQNLSGRIGYNDVSSVSNWYLNDSGVNDSVEGVYYNAEDRSLAKHNPMLEKGLDYLIVTNEHNTTMEFDNKERPYLTEVKEFKKEINGKIFFTRIYKVER